MATKQTQEPEQNTQEPEQQVAEAVAAAPAFTKKQIVNSRTYARHVDLLNALLNDKKTYTHAEIEEIIKNAFSGKYQLK